MPSSHVCVSPSAVATCTTASAASSATTTGQKRARTPGHLPAKVFEVAAQVGLDLPGRRRRLQVRVAVIADLVQRAQHGWVVDLSLTQVPAVLEVECADAILAKLADLAGRVRPHHVGGVADIVPDAEGVGTHLVEHAQVVASVEQVLKAQHPPAPTATDAAHGMRPPPCPSRRAPKDPVRICNSFVFRTINEHREMNGKKR